MSNLPGSSASMPHFPILAGKPEVTISLETTNLFMSGDWER